MDQANHGCLQWWFTRAGPTCCCCCLQWFTRAGFEDVKLKRIGPSWYRGVRRHGLIMGCSVTGVKKAVSRRCRSHEAVAGDMRHLLVLP